MTVGYFDDAGDIYAEGAICPGCGSTSTLRNMEFGDWKCENCSTVWNEHDQVDEAETPDLCVECWGTGVKGTEGDPDSDLPDQWSDITCSTCGGSGYV